MKQTAPPGENGRSRRLLLLATPHTYRVEAFLAAARRLGIEVVVGVDMPPALAEMWSLELPLDFNDSAAALQAIDAYHRQRPFGAIMGVDDSGSLLAAQASAALGLPHNEPGAVLAARDKYVMRQMLRDGGVPTPYFHRSEPGDDLDRLVGTIDYPCVVKPLRLSGSRGVIRAGDPASFRAAVARLQRLLVKTYGRADQPFLVESFIPGVEVALEGLLEEGHLRVLALFDKPDPLDGPFFEETIYVTPSRLPVARQAEIVAAAAAAARALGLRTGPVHAELRLNEAGPWVIELAGRSIGGLCSRVLRFGFDASLEELILRQAFGLPVELDREPAPRGVMMIPIPAGGLLRQVKGVSGAEAVAGVEGVTITAKINNLLTPLPEGESYLGFIFARGETPAAVEAALRQAHAALRFEIEPIIELTPVQTPIPGTAAAASPATASQ